MSSRVPFLVSSFLVTFRLIVCTALLSKSDVIESPTSPIDKKDYGLGSKKSNTDGQDLSEKNSKGSSAFPIAFYHRNGTEAACSQNASSTVKSPHAAADQGHQ